MASSPKSMNKNDKRKETPESIEFPGDIRKEEGSGKYGLATVTKTKSGHSLIFDDSEGHESVTIQHRSGSAVQMAPDGAVHITAHNSLYTVVFGENRMTVTGAHDITVKGDASMRVYGDMNTTVHGNYNLAVNGDFNVTSKNLNRHVRGNMDTQAKNINKKVEGSYTVTAQGAMAHVAKGAVTSASISDKCHIGGSTGVNVAVNEGDMTCQVKKGNMHMKTDEGKFDGLFSDGTNDVSILAEKGKLHMQSDKAANLESKQDAVQVQAQKDVSVKSATSGVKMSAPSGNISTVAGNKVQVTAGADMQMKSAGTAGFEGATTHVGGQTGTTHVVGGNVNVEPLAGLLNLAGGLGIPMPDMGQLSFLFDIIEKATGLPDIKSIAAQLPDPEGDHKSETGSWL